MSGATENEIMFQVTFKDALEVDCYSGFFSIHVRYMLSPVRPSVICLPVTPVHPTQAVVIFRNYSMAFGTLAIR